MAAVEMVNRRIGPLRVLRLLGAGSMGAVYEAVHEEIGQRVAIKILHRSLSSHRQIAARFRNEARAISVVHHPGVVGILDFRQLEDGAACIIMEYLEGETLQRRLQRRRLEVAAAARLARQMALALAAAHAKGVVHRDLKPTNVMIVAEPELPDGERAKLLDFGVAKLTEACPAADLPGEEVHTQSGAVIGTIAYMAPEQCGDAGEVDGKADVYALGVVLYEMLAGHTPFQASAPATLALLRITTEPPSLRVAVPHAPERLVTLVRAMLARCPADRPTISEVSLELGDLVESDTTPMLRISLGAEEPPTARLAVSVGLQVRRTRWWVALAAGLLGIAAVSWRLWPMMAGAQPGLIGETPTRAGTTAVHATAPTTAPRDKATELEPVRPAPPNKAEARKKEVPHGHPSPAPKHPRVSAPNAPPPAATPSPAPATVAPVDAPVPTQRLKSSDDALDS